MTIHRDHRGRLDVVQGAMFAGKTTCLIDRLHHARQRGVPAVAFKHARDTRHDAHALTTHDNRRFLATAVEHALDIRFNGAAGALIAIDEVHFFGAAVIEPIAHLLHAGHDVLAAGVALDAAGVPFAPLPELMEHADAIVTLRARCATCGTPTLLTQRLSGSPARFEPGGAEAYEPRCAEHFVAVAAAGEGGA